MWHVEEIMKAVHGIAHRIERDTFSDISTDSRTIREGEFFIPINGVTFDGHKFIAGAYERSHGGAICEKGREESLKGTKGTIILVDDTLKALLDIRPIQEKIIERNLYCYNGSNGKTTTKEILVAIIGSAGRSISMKRTSITL